MLPIPSILIVVAIGTVFLVAVDYRRRRSRETGVKQFYVIREGRANAIFGLLLAVFALSVKRPPDSGYAMGGLLAGGAAGLLIGAWQCNRWKGELKREGHLMPEVVSRAPLALLKEGLIFVALALGMGLAMALGARTKVTYLAHGASASVLAAGAAFFLLWGVYTLVWAKRKERQGFRNLVFTIRRVSGAKQG